MGGPMMNFIALPAVSYHGIQVHSDIRVKSTLASLMRLVVTCSDFCMTCIASLASLLSL